MSANESDRSFTRDIVLVAALWCLSLPVVNPIGNFPLVDDWGFGRTVKHFLETGQYDSLGWGYMTLVTNVLWGSLFSLPAGFSFTALRFSTLVASLAGLIGAYVLFRDLQQPRWLALLIVAALACNPVYLAMSHTFMTDVPFTALALWTSIFLLRSLRTHSTSQLLAGTALALAATLSRQLALCIPVAFATVVFLKSPLTRQTVLRACLPLIVCAAGYLGVYSAGMIGIKVDQLVIQSVPYFHKFVRTIVNSAFSTLIHLGLFLFPILLLGLKSLRELDVRRLVVPAAIGIVTMAVLVAARLYFGDGVLLPLFHNILVKSGVGPTIIRDVFLLKLDNMRPLPGAFWITVTALGFAGAVLLITTVTVLMWRHICNLRREEPLSDDDAVSIFAVLTSIIYFALLLPAPLYFDRYVIPMIPFLAVAVLSVPGRFGEVSIVVAQPVRLAAVGLLAAFGLFALAGTRDYLAWNRIRWTALEELMRDSHVGPDDIDGGFEFNGLYARSLEFAPQPQEVSPWWVRRDTYQIGFGPVPGYEIARQYTYRRWLPWHLQTVVVLRKKMNSVDPSQSQAH